ncbi:MAG TPA: PRC-barrel domain-containing protein, partial [Terriglobales bacterium]|nr:PRC-barrel domain-containing protein [Terriglobales bacterium]
MLRQMRRIKDLRELTIRATDGDIGKLEDLYFDDHTWSVRYLVVNTGSWLLGRRVLLAPVSVSGFEDSAAVMQIGLTREEVRNSPPVDTQKPISRQYEEEYYRYYGWVPYWGAGAVMGPYPPPPRAIARVSKNEEVPASEIRQTHLRATSEVTGYYVEALDGEIGHVEDLVVDDRDWVVSYFEVDTRNWWAGKKVLVSRTWI